MIKTFPSIPDATLYVPSGQNNRIPIGRLYLQYSNWRRELYSVKLIDKVFHVKNQPLSQEDVMEDELEKEEKLRETIEPWTEVVHLWNATYHARKNELIKSLTFEAYFHKYPCLSDSRSKFFLSEDGSKVGKRSLIILRYL